MSLVVAVKSLEGLVLAADSRLTISLGTSGALGSRYAHSDHEMKIWTFPPPHNFVAMAFYGSGRAPSLADVAGRVQAELPNRRLSVPEFADVVARVIATAISNAARVSALEPPTLTAIVVGFDSDAEEGRVFAVTAPERPEPEEHHVEGLGLTWGGMREIVDRLLLGHDSDLCIPLETMPIEACVDLATFLIQTTADTLRFVVSEPAVGGPVDVATVTAHGGVRFVCRKAEQLARFSDWQTVGPLAIPAVVSADGADISRPSTYTHPYDEIEGGAALLRQLNARMAAFAATAGRTS